MPRTARSHERRASSPRIPSASSRPGEWYGRYELLHKVAHGGMASVWLARLEGEYGFERDVAIKMILPTYARDPNFRHMFLDEARIASRVQHPNVAQILDLGEHDGKLYMVMEWVDGASLADLLQTAEKKRRAIPLPVILRIIADACAGLHAAHELRDAQGRKLEVVHRDVSPQNVLVGDSGCVKVIDFGVLKARERLVDETLDGIVKGKLPYVAPERALGVTADCRADVWALGAILYRILGGRLVYEGQNDLAIIRELVSQSPVRPLPRSVPRALREIVNQALARDPNDRYASMAEFQRDLEAMLHRFDAATTAHDVGAFVGSIMGSTLSERRSSIDRARVRADETSSAYHFTPSTRPYLKLVSNEKPLVDVPLVDLPRIDEPVEPPAILRPARIEVRKPSSNLLHPNRLVVGGLVLGLAVLVAALGFDQLATSHESTPLHAASPLAQPALAPVAAPRSIEPQRAARPIVTPVTTLPVVSLADLPLEPTRARRVPSAPRPKVHSAQATRRPRF